MKIQQNLDLLISTEAEKVTFNIIEGDANDFLIRQLDQEDSAIYTLSVKSKGALRFLVEAIKIYLEKHDEHLEKNK